MLLFNCNFIMHDISPGFNLQILKQVYHDLITDQMAIPTVIAKQDALLFIIAI